MLPYNDSTIIEETFAKSGEEIAAVIIEPFSGQLRPNLAKARLSRDNPSIVPAKMSLLIFDEVMTGFRLALGGVQELTESFQI